MVNLILQTLIRSTIISSLIICILIILNLTLLKGFSKRLNYYIWLIAIAKLVIPFTYTYTTNKLDTKSLLDNSNIDNFPINENIIIFIWSAIALLLFIRIIKRYLKFKSLIVDLSYDIEEIEVKNLYGDLLNEFKIKGNIKLKYTYEVANPSCFGLFEKYILLPPHDYSLEELNWILRHELTHYKSKDLYIRYLILFLKCVYWFNPLVYLLDRVVENICEMHCDETVLKDYGLEDRQSYAMTVVNSIERNTNIHNEFSTGLYRIKGFEKRLHNMFITKNRKGIIIALILCLLSSLTYLTFDSISYKSPDRSIYKKFPLKDSVYKIHVDV
ncbi:MULTISPECIES: M56 family metallopeptidase [unclassified Clostridioides]|uniref:M56 family metallopeptidase n=2 Tax=Clostridioides TaxID=1870884 RepID=UPI001D0C6262|nr:M56 family metallopeptidase [Clostridioides sp. ES-W-0018-02]MCC0705339.1 M56 family metallopeptidase [Clostridioides sp. ES-S-0049-02]MCC0713454.1 M56 family metallopeptidase [Clostridioides sp. ES-W-0017-02]MCC0765223.1 M56 family metallopeptidase [Clostridioides sp. ES-S-0006-03]